MVRGPCCEKTGLNKGKWTPEEDRRLIAYIQKHGQENWHVLPKKAGLLRCGKSCRLRWVNYLRPNIKRGNYTKEEEEIIIDLNKSLGNRWSAIAAKLPGRTDNEIKNHWHTHLKRQLKQTPTSPKEKAKSMGIAECNAIVMKELQVSGNKSDVTIHPTTENSSTPPECLTHSPDDASCADENISIDDKSQHTDSTKTAVESNENSISESSSSLESFGLQEDFLGTFADSELQFTFSPIASQENLSPNYPCSDSMEFWLNMLMETTKLPEI